MAGFFGIGDFTKEGKGVDKNAPEKRSFFLFWELFFRKFSRLIKLNLLYIVSIIPTAIVVFIISGFVSSAIIKDLSPVMAEFFNASGSAAPANEEYMRLAVYLDIIIRAIITVMFTVLWGMGPVTCGFTYILRNYARQEHAWMLSDFFEKTKSNFKQGIIVWLIDLVMFILLFNAYSFYSSQTGIISVIKYFIVSFIIIYTMMHFYIYQLMITFELTLKQLYRNSFILALGKLPRNILILAATVFANVIIPYLAIYSSAFYIYVLVYIVLLLLILISFCGFLINFFVYPVIKNELLDKAKAADEMNDK